MKTWLKQLACSHVAWTNIAEYTLTTTIAWRECNKCGKRKQR